MPNDPHYTLLCRLQVARPRAAKRARRGHGAALAWIDAAIQRAMEAAHR